jgi:deoxycytidylate deaminase
MNELLLNDFARLTRMLAKHSPCKRRGVACIVFEPETDQLIGWGTNHPARGRICSGEKDNCGCLHSEVNTILNARPRDYWGKNHMICSRAPCVPCSSVIVNCGFIDKVYVLDESEPGAHGIGVLKNADIIVEFITCPEGAEIGLRDGTVVQRETLYLPKLKEELMVVRDRLARNGDVDGSLMARRDELEKQIKQVS